MLQPFVLFSHIYLKRVVQLRKRYLVSQTYKRAKDHFSEDARIDILLTDYDDMGLAKTHDNAIKTDKYHAILDLDNTVHVDKLKSMMQEGSKYQLFWAVVNSKADLEKRINTHYKDHMRRYITKHTNWRISSDIVVTPKIQITF